MRLCLRWQRPCAARETHSVHPYRGARCLDDERDESQMTVSRRRKMVAVTGATPQDPKSLIAPVRFKGCQQSGTRTARRVRRDGVIRVQTRRQRGETPSPRSANCVALVPSDRDKVTLLVVVDEVKSPDPGLVSDKVVGLADLDRQQDHPRAAVLRRAHPPLRS